MKKIFASLLLCVFAFVAHAQTTVVFPLAQMTGTTNDTDITVKPVNNPVKFNSQIYWLPTAGIVLHTTNGSATTNLIPNDYNVAIKGVPGSWKISVNDTNVTLNAAEIGNLTTYTFTDLYGYVKKIVPGTGITISPSSGQGNVTVNSTGGSGGSATNAYQSQVSGSGLTISTNILGLYYTFALNAALQGWSTMSPGTYSNSINSGVQGWLQLSNNAYQAQFAASNAFYLAAFDPLGSASTVSNALQNVYVITNGSGSAEFQTAFNSLTNGGVVWPRPGTYWLSNSVQITNANITLFGYGATFNYPVSKTNAMFYSWPTNFAKPLNLIGATFDGLQASNYFSTNYFSVLYTGTSFGALPDPGRNPLYSNRTAIKIECSGGVIVKDCTFRGWSGNGALFYSIAGGTPLGSGYSPERPQLRFTGNTCYSNFQAVLLAGRAEDIAGYYNGDTTGLGAWNCEYSHVIDNSIFLNYIGVNACAGNDNVSYNNMDENWIAFMLVGGTVNSTHGIYTGNHIAHGTWAIWSTLNNGGLFANNYISRNFSATSGFTNNSGIHFDKVVNLTFKNNVLGYDALEFTNGCSGEFADNSFEAGLVWGISVKTNFTGSTMRIRNNADTTGQNDDGSMGSILSTATNAPTAGAFAYTPDGVKAAWTFNGSGLTSLNASQLTSGTVPDAQIGGNIARTNNVNGPLHTNAYGIVLCYTNGTPLWNVPDGSHCFQTSGQEWSRTNGTWVPINITGTGSGGSGTVTSVDVAQQGFSSSGAVNGAGTITLTQNADKNHLGFSETNISNGAFTNTAVVGGTGIDPTNAFQVNARFRSKALQVSTNGVVYEPTAAIDILTGATGDTIEQRNSTTAQQFNIYQSYTDASNYRRGSLYFSGSDFYISGNGLGTGAGSGNTVLEAVGAHRITFRTAGVDKWTVLDDGTLKPLTDDTYNFGVFGGPNVKTNYSEFFFGSGINLTNLNASQLLSGTVPMARLDPFTTTNRGTLAGTVLKGDGARGVTNATAGVDFIAPAAVLTNSIYDTNIVISTNNWNWPGPTNNLDFARGTLQRYRPADTTPLSITNFLNFPVGQVGPMVLRIENTNLTALSVKLPATLTATNSLGGLTVSVNASNTLQMLFTVDPVMTNVLFTEQQLIK